jgi:HSP90 family molecular chaperone
MLHMHGDLHKVWSLIRQHAMPCAQEEYKDLVAWWKEQLGSAVSGVKVSNRLATSPAAVSTSKYGWNANMERIMKSQVHNTTPFSLPTACLGPRMPRPCTCLPSAA